MTPRTLTDRQQQVLDTIRVSVRLHGRAPTVREIATTMGIASTNGVSDHLKALQRKGYIRRDSVVSRGIVLVDSVAESVARVAARERAEMLIAFAKLLDTVEGYLGRDLDKVPPVIVLISTLASVAHEARAFLGKEPPC